MSSKGKKIIIVTLIILGIDQLTKWLVLKHLSMHSIPVIGNFMRFTLVQNFYGIFGLKFKIPFIPLTILAVCVLYVILCKFKVLALSLILGGALGNLIDRIRFGAVIDFLDFGIGKLRWFTFNVADAAITIGILWLLIASFKKKNKSYISGAS
ncbi:signal peptidase II [candidate division WOR-3 bacterium]|nr:signal peptidase II [candidate division WOR-3 bacterium]